jgi:hypothetical protein
MPLSPYSPPLQAFLYTSTVIELLLIRKSMVQKSFMSPARTSFNLEEALQKI